MNEYKIHIFIALGILCFLSIALCCLDLWQKKQNRLKRRLSHFLTFGLSIVLLFCLVGFYFYFQTNKDIGIAISILGLSQGAIPAILVFSYKRFFLLKRNVVFLSKSNSLFCNGIYNGFEKEIKNHKVFSSLVVINKMFPHGKDVENVAFQLEALKSKVVHDADALVFIPVSADEDIKKELVRLAKNGVFLILIDHKIEESVFFENKVSSLNLSPLSRPKIVKAKV